MLRDDKFKLIWSTWLDEQVCKNIYDDDCSMNCDDDGGCPFRNDGYYEYDYDYLNDYIEEDFNLRFDDKDNHYKYFVIDDCYCKIVDGEEIHRFSEIIGSLKDVLYWLSDGVGQYEFRIYYGGYNRLYIELSHHDGSEVVQLVRLNKKGQDYYDRGYDIDYNKYCITGVAKDFKDLKFYINR